MEYQLDDELLYVEIIKKNNKNTYIRLKDNKTIYVTTNFFTSKSYIKKLLDNNKDFLRRSLKKINKKIEREESFLLLGNKYNVVMSSNMDKVEINKLNNIIYCKDEKMLNKWLKKEMANLFLKRLDYNYNLFTESIPYPKLKIRNMKTRWGVCNRKNLTVTLNSKLIEYELDKLDYVIIHELSHLVHFNHSASFWQTVSKYCPNYKTIRNELKD